LVVSATYNHHNLAMTAVDAALKCGIEHGLLQREERKSIGQGGRSHHYRQVNAKPSGTAIFNPFETDF
jgi:predicted transcriptional regulator